MKTIFLRWGSKLSQCAWLAAFVLLALAASANADSHFPRIWMDQSSGYAIGGYDPVEYFVHAKALRPDGGVEAFWGGVSWKFRNIGNKQAFLAHPEIYAPRFGGADAYLMAKHKQVLGNPTLFDVYEGRLYLFYNGLSLSRWRQHRAAYVIHAKQAWPKAALRLGLDAVIAKPAKPAKPAKSSEPEIKPDIRSASPFPDE